MYLSCKLKYSNNKAHKATATNTRKKEKKETYK